MCKSQLPLYIRVLLNFNFLNSNRFIVVHFQFPETPQKSVIIFFFKRIRLHLIIWSFFNFSELKLFGIFLTYWTFSQEFFAIEETFLFCVITCILSKSKNWYSQWNFFVKKINFGSPYIWNLATSNYFLKDVQSFADNPISYTDKWK